jgi:hypothetical protein
MNVFFWCLRYDSCCLFLARSSFTRLSNRFLLLSSGFTIYNVALLLPYAKHYLHRHYCDVHASAVFFRNECYASDSKREEQRKVKRISPSTAAVQQCMHFRLQVKIHLTPCRDLIEDMQCRFREPHKKHATTVHLRSCFSYK